MKTRCSAATACLLGLTLPAAPAEAQFPLTFAAGPVFATISGDDVGDDVESETGFFVAVGTAIPVSGETVALAPFVGYTQRGWKEPDGEGQLTYIDVPVFLSAGFPLAGTTTFSVSAGPRVSFQLSCEFEESGGGSVDCPEDEEKSLDFGSAMWGWASSSPPVDSWRWAWVTILGSPTSSRPLRGRTAAFTSTPASRCSSAAERTTRSACVTALAAASRPRPRPRPPPRRR